MAKCPKCGAELIRGLKYTFVCGTSELTAGGYEDGKECLRRQLAAANAKLEESARLATDSAQLADSLAKDLAAANERAGRLEEALSDIKTNNQNAEFVYDRASKALEVPDAL